MCGRSTSLLASPTASAQATPSATSEFLHGALFPKCAMPTVNSVTNDYASVTEANEQITSATQTFILNIKLPLGVKDRQTNEKEGGCGGPDKTNQPPNSIATPLQTQECEGD